MKQDEPFVIKAYWKSELAMLYFPKASRETALKRLNHWLRINPRLRYLLNRNINDFTPKQVKQIVEEFGNPYEYQ